MNKVNLINGNETKSDIYPWNISKSHAIFFIKKVEVFQWLNGFQNRNFPVL